MNASAVSPGLRSGSDRRRRPGVWPGSRRQHGQTTRRVRLPPRPGTSPALTATTGDSASVSGGSGRWIPRLQRPGQAMSNHESGLLRDAEGLTCVVSTVAITGPLRRSRAGSAHPFAMSGSGATLAATLARLPPAAASSTAGISVAASSPSATTAWAPSCATVSPACAAWAAPWRPTGPVDGAS